MCEQNMPPFSLQIFLETLSILKYSVVCTGDGSTSVYRSASGVTCSGFRVDGQTDTRKAKLTSAYCQLGLRRRRKLASHGAAQSLVTLDV